MVATPGDAAKGIPSDPTNGALIADLPEVRIDIAYGGSCTAGKEADLERSMSYAENAAAKARYFATRAGWPTVADDSGLEVEALGGAPGPRSARWSLDGNDAANKTLLLEQLAGVPPERRAARYRCVVCFLATPSSVPRDCGSDLEFLYPSA